MAPTAAILEIHRHLWTDFHQIWCADRHSPNDCNLYQKLRLCQNSRWRQRHLRFWIFGHISVVSENICLKFGKWIDIDHTRVSV